MLLLVLPQGTLYVDKLTFSSIPFSLTREPICYLLFAKIMKNNKTLTIIIILEEMYLLYEKIVHVTYTTKTQTYGKIHFIISI